MNIIDVKITNDNNTYVWLQKTVLWAYENCPSFQFVGEIDTTYNKDHKFKLEQFIIREVYNLCYRFKFNSDDDAILFSMRWL